MSAIASFYLIDTSKLNELSQNAGITVKRTLFSKKITDNYFDYLNNNTTVLKSFNGPGYAYSNAFAYLQEEKNIDLTQNEYDSIVSELIDKRGATHMVFTHQQKMDYLDQLDRDKHSFADIKLFNEEFSDEGDEETARFTLDAIQTLCVNLSNLQNDKQVLLLIVG